jgi:protein-tyrosine phosphatase
LGVVATRSLPSVVEGLGYVDIHSHILHGLDDGAETLEDSVKMIELAANHGTSDIVATPHANARYRFDPALVDQRVTELTGRVDIRIHRGCDFHLQVDNIHDAIAHPSKYTINNKGYLLVEFPHHAVFSTTDEILAELLDAGVVPIITHPERNAQLQDRFDDLARWVEHGCYVQVTAGSYTGAFGRRPRSCADEMLQRGLVHFVASDAHDCGQRSPNLRGAYQMLADIWGEEVIRPLFVDNPRAVLNGDAVDLERTTAQSKRRKWFQFWG